MKERSRHDLGNLKEVVFYDDGSSEIILCNTNPLHRVTLSNQETDRLEKVLKWR